MKFIIVWAILGSLCTTAYAQSDYAKAKRALAYNKLDSSRIYVDRAIQYFTQQKNTDSLAMSLALETHIVWEKEPLPQAFSSLYRNLPILAQLPQKSTGRVLLNSIAGSLHTYKYQFDSAQIYYNRALSAADTITPNIPLVILYNNIARMDSRRENRNRMEYYAEKAFTSFQKQPEKDSTLLIDLYLSKTQYAIVSGDYVAALETGLMAESLLNKVYPPDHPKVGTVYGNISTIFYYLSRYEEALHYRQKSLSAYLASNPININENQQFYSAYYNMGQLYFYLYERNLASQYLEKALQIAGNVYGKRNLALVVPLIRYASILQKLGRSDEARTFFLEAYSIQQELDPADNSSMGYVESFYAEYFYEEKEYEAAVNYYKLALDSYKKANEVNGYYGLYAQAELAIAYADLGDYQRAVSMQKTALQLFRKNFPLLKQSVVDFLANLSDIYSKMGQPDSALLYSDSTLLLQGSLDSLPNNPATWLQKLPFSFKTGELIEKRQRTLLAVYGQRKQTKYLAEILQIADLYGAFASDNIYKLRTQSSITDQSDLNKSIFSFGIDAAWELALATGDKSYYEKAFLLAEAGKALLLRLSSNNFMVDVSIGDNDPDIKRDVAFRKKISALNEQYLNEETESVLRELTNAIEEYRILQDSLKKAGNAYFQKRYAVASYSMDEIRKEILHKKATLIEYSVTEKYLYTFVITNDSFYYRRSNNDIITTVTSLQNPEKTAAKDFKEKSSKLYGELIKPVESYFTHTDNLIIVPDKELYYLNFESLVTNDADSYGALDYLIYKYNISYLLSCYTTIQFEKFSQTKSQQKAIMFAPVFTDEMKQHYQKQMKADQGDSSYLFLYRQPFALQTIKDVYRMVTADLFVEQDAQESSFKRVSDQYNILHLGTHTQISDVAPLHSRLYFAKPYDEKTATDDGNLYAFEIYGMQLKAKLAVLTACETGKGTVRQGEGTMSLAHSFMFAGCPSVMMTLWKIDEKTSAEIITAFYKYLNKGHSKSESLRMAKLDFLKSNPGEMANPFYWAGICIIGDDAPLYASNGYLYWLGGLLLLAITGWIYLRKRKAVSKNVLG